MKTCGDFGGKKRDGSPCGAPAGRGTQRKTGRCHPHLLEHELPDEPLSVFHERFVEEYLVDLNAARAYRAAGGGHAGAKQNGHKLLQRADIQAAIQRRQAELREEVGVRQLRVLQELGALAFSDMRKVAEWGPKSVRVRSSRSIDDMAAAAVSEVRMTKDGPVIKLHPKGDAIQKYMQHLGMLVDRSVNIDIDYDSLPEEALERIKAGENHVNVLVSLIQQVGEGK